MRHVRLLVSAVLVSALGACGSSRKNAEADAKPACECKARQQEEEGCDCPHCAAEESGWDPVACPCSERGR